MISGKTESCSVPLNDTAFQQYHDEEWGVPTTDDHAFFEKVCLEGFQSGLSWQIILKRRKALRVAFDNFDPEPLARYSESDVIRLMNNEQIIRNRRKIMSVINNARQFDALRDEFGSLSEFFWSFEPEASTRPDYLDRSWLNSHPFTPESHALSKALKKRGWTFIGPTNMYALMQALGIVNDHVEGCPRRAIIEILRNKKPTAS
ncbi:MAG: DNA-3-methyladenine glycosylase I [Granulosicoccus sp.]